MITNIYGKQLSDLEKMRVEEKIRHVKEAIPDEVYEVLTTEWRRFVTRSVEQGQGEMKLEELLFEYQCKMMTALKKPSSRKRHTNVLMHIQGFFKNKLEKDDKAELMDKIEQYRRGYIPLMAPLTLLNHHLNHFPNPYLEDQKYFSPYPLELGLQA